MAEWLYEDGIGERRAALIDDGAIVAIGIERDSDGVRAGTIAAARLSGSDGSALRVVRFDSGEEAIVSQLPHGLSDGAKMLVEVTRSAIPEIDLVKRAKARPAADDAVAKDGADLLARISATGNVVRTLQPHEPDTLEAAGWSEALAEAAGGRIAFDGGLLRMSLTPAMTVFDIDGALPAAALAEAGARAVAAAILRLDIAGSIVVDFPTLADKAARVAVAEEFDAAMHGAFDRTAINGYGLLQIIRPRVRASVAERMQFAPIESAALALLRRAERAQGHGSITVTAHPALCAWLDARPALLAALARRTGRPATLQVDPARAIWSGDVH